MKKYSLLIEWDEESQVYVATCPEFAGIVNMGGPFAHGDTWEEAGKEAAIALEGLIESLQLDDHPLKHLPLPEPRHYKPKGALWKNK